MTDGINQKLPKEAQEKVKKFRDAFRVYFKSQRDAEDTLKVGQAAISRYLDGKSPMPMEVAVRFSDFTNGQILYQDIWFDLSGYRYDQRKSKKTN